MLASLRELVAPLTEADFLRLLLERRLTHQRGAGGNRYAELLTIAGMLDLFDQGTYDSQTLRITRNRRILQPAFYSEKGKLSRSKLENLLEGGASIVLEPLQPYVPALDALCADIAARIPEKIKAGAILTGGACGAFEMHFDTEDLMILQVEGCKHWHIYGSPVSNPIKGMRHPPTPVSEPVFDEVLEPGDFLFLPAGYWHCCESRTDRSLHLGIFIKPPSGWHAVQALIGAMIDEDALFRTPLTRGTPAERAALERTVKERLIKKIEDLSLAQMLERHDKGWPDFRSR